MLTLWQDEHLTLVERMQWLILSQMQDNCHAPFSAGEIYDLLSITNKTTGEKKPLSRRRFYEAKRELIRRGILAKNQRRGGDRCFIVSKHFDRSWRPSKRCVHSEPRVRQGRFTLSPAAMAEDMERLPFL